MNEARKELFKLYRDKQEKFIYYLIALAVAALGFAITKTYDQPLKYSQIPLGLAVYFWATSIHNGLKFLQYDLGALYANQAYYEILDGENKISGTHPEKIKIGTEEMQNVMDSHADKGANHAKSQKLNLYAGILLFIAYRFIEMYLLTLQK